jgi:hypothetical protein
MSHYTTGYMVEKLNPWDEWTPVATFYACRQSESPATVAEVDKAWMSAFDTAREMESKGTKVRIVAHRITVENTPVWEGTGKAERF